MITLANFGSGQNLHQFIEQLEIDRLTSGVSESEDKINKSAADLSKIASNLGDLVGTFKIS